MALVKPRTPTGTTRTLTGLVLIAGLVLTGCGSTNSDGDDEGTGGATSAPTTTTSTEPGEGEYAPASAEGPAQNVPVPELPEEASEQSIEGAEATLEYWWNAMEYLYLTGNAEQLLAASEDNCELCNVMVDTWGSTYMNNEWTSLDGEITVTTTLSTVNDEVTQADVDYSLTHPELRHYGSSGEEKPESRTRFEDQPWFAILKYDESTEQWLLYESVASDLLSDEGQNGD